MDGRLFGVPCSTYHSLFTVQIEQVEVKDVGVDIDIGISKQ
jgi:hypothetical protein